MGILDIFRRRPAPEPETPAERERREVMSAVRTLQRFGFNPAGPVARSRQDSLASATMGMGGSLELVARFPNRPPVIIDGLGEVTTQIERR